MGYGGQESRDLEAATDDTDCDTAVIGTPTDPNQVNKIDKLSPGGSELGLTTSSPATSTSTNTWPFLATEVFWEVTRDQTLGSYST